MEVDILRLVIPLDAAGWTSVLPSRRTLVGSLGYCLFVENLTEWYFLQVS